MIGKRHFPFCLLICLCLFLIVCAKISPPPGGPIDKTGPAVDSTIPGNGSINVPGDNVIEVYFSEKIDKASIKGSIFISPRFSDEPKYKLKGKRLRLVLPNIFSDNTTYVVNIGSSVRDIRGNRMDNSFVFAFSTGEKISEGTVKGKAFKNDEPYSGAAVGLFDFLRPDTSAGLDSTYPPYLTQSGISGEYSLEFLPDGEYFVLAFDDKNKNQLFNYPRESFGIPDKTAHVSSGLPPSNINFYLIEEDTALITILSTALTGDRLLKVRFSGNLLSDSLKNNLDRIYLVPYDSTISHINPDGILEQKGLKTSVYNLYFKSLKEGNYRLQCESALFGGKIDSMAIIESGEFFAGLEPDDSPPEILSVSHSGKTVFPSDSIIQVYFSEPIDDNFDIAGTVEILDSDSLPYDFSHEWPDEFNLNLHTIGLKWNRKYNIILSENLITDLAGNSIGDSVVSFDFSTYDRDSLGSVSGTLVVETGADSRAVPYITFRSITGKFSTTRPIVSNSFNLALPPGKYFLSGFLDRDGNEKQDYGSLRPFRFSEPSASYPDTIRVRARFETAGIEFFFR
jgi:uncharacterized protein (DUF2141 family)